MYTFNNKLQYARGYDLEFKDPKFKAIFGPWTSVSKPSAQLQYRIIGSLTVTLVNSLKESGTFTYTVIQREDRNNTCMSSVYDNRFLIGSLASKEDEETIFERAGQSNRTSLWCTHCWSDTFPIENSGSITIPSWAASGRYFSTFQHVSHCASCNRIPIAWDPFETIDKSVFAYVFNAFNHKKLTAFVEKELADNYGLYTITQYRDYEVKMDSGLKTDLIDYTMHPSYIEKKIEQFGFDYLSCIY